ncbi:MBL fold metallo-hydrolase [Opitutaceae bacterium TAV4]|nr:MBL fold metallo-hydrolase [Opitutaceae bacterium TAV4]RRJ94505.1 MBL fold metallo-hydrolase [Opitutaceae bacterium TAV4]RRJ98567.1 MBL fold metallo-hydrolase [Opitutaceae bacterium TAV3]
MSTRVYPLGQVGYLFEFNNIRIVIDPYLTDSVAEQFGASLRRLCLSTLAPSELTAVSWVLLTHAHLDHTDPKSLAALWVASPEVRFAAPYECHELLESIGVPASHLVLVSAGDVISLAENLRVRTIPAAHTEMETDATGRSRYVGYYIESKFAGIYHAGDTIPHEAIFAALEGARIDYAFLPVNECNLFKIRNGIVGNMTPREAFSFAERIGARRLVPTHWDLFAPNCTFPWEIEALYAALRPPFELRFMPCGSVHLL